MHQDGLWTDERAPARTWLSRLQPARPEARIVVRTLLIADAVLILVAGALMAVFMQQPEGFVGAGGCLALAALLGSIAHAM